jgi:hypothetical protein
MKLGSGDGNGQDKKQTVIAIVAILVIVIAVAMLAKNFVGGGSESASSAPPGARPMPPGTVGGPPDVPQPRSGGGLPPGEVEPTPRPASGAAPAAPPTPAPAPAEPAPRATAPPPAAKPEPAKSQPAPAGPTRQIKVFGTVTVSYPASWKISTGGGNSYAVFTDGNARFSVHPPDLKADSARKIAQLAMKQITPGAVVTKEGTDRVGSREAYWFAVKYQGRVARVVGIDAPTRIAVVETVKTGDFGKYRDTFDKLQSGITFAGK